MSRSIVAFALTLAATTASVASAHPTAPRAKGLVTNRPGTVTYVLAKRNSDLSVTAWQNRAGGTPAFTMPAIYNNPMTRMWLGMWGWSEMKNGVVQY